jgi:outer membrane lipoprotein-sorting protein
VKTLTLIIIAFSFLSFSGCAVKKPEITLPEAPAGELVRALDLRRQSFSGLKAVASAQVVRKGRKRSYDTVGVVLEAQRKFRIEVYGPLGQSLLVLVWDGKEPVLRFSGQDAVMRPGPFALERLLGVGMEMSDLCAVLSGNIPDTAATAGAKAFCGQDGSCVVELRQGEITRRAWIKRSQIGATGEVKLTMYEVYRAESLLFRATFEQVETISGYPLPMRVVLENPDKNVSLAVAYNDVDVNVPIDESLFTLTDGEAAAP